MFIARQRLGKRIPETQALNNRRTSTARQRLGKQALNKYATNNRRRPLLGNGRVFYGSASRLYK
jgi:hypothetical protein